MTQDVFIKLSLNGPRNNEQARTNMLKQQIRTWDVLDDKILALFYSIPRENFVPVKYQSLAFADMCLPLGEHGQTMMTPKEEARILQELHIDPQDKILVVGTDSGYLITLLSKLGKQVHYLDNDLENFESVKNKLAANNISNISTHIGNIHQGWQEYYPYDVIFLTGSLPVVPDSLKNALAIKGRLFVVVGKSPAMAAKIITRLSENTWSENRLFETLRPRMMDIKEPDTFIF